MERATAQLKQESQIESDTRDVMANLWGACFLVEGSASSFYAGVQSRIGRGTVAKMVKRNSSGATCSFSDILRPIRATRS
jgi:hypothetical protein